MSVAKSFVQLIERPRFEGLNRSDYLIVLIMKEGCNRLIVMGSLDSIIQDSFGLGC